MDMIQTLAQQEMARQMKVNPDQFKTPTTHPLPVEKPWLTPDRLATIGGVADAASTYAFLKQGSGAEGNAMLGFAHNSPTKTALGALAGLGLSKAATALLRRISPSAANAVAANLGAMQLMYGVGNVMDTTQPSSRMYQSAMQRAVTR